MKKEDCSKNKKVCLLRNQGFTLIEIMIVIAIIGILAGVIMVNSGSGVERAKRASVLTSMASVLPELVACNDDGGFAKSSAPNSGEYICCTSATTCGAGQNKSGHIAKWPDITNTNNNGWVYGAPTNSLSTGDYTFRATKTINGTSETITCDYASSTCN